MPSFSSRAPGALALVLVGLLGLFSATAADDAPPLIPIKFIPHWTPQAQFAGYYVAQARGFYREAGLDVTILRGGPQAPALDLLAKGEADFATSFLSSALVARDQNNQVVNIAQIGQRSALLLVARKSSGIRVAGDLNGKKLSVWDDFRAQPVAFLKKNGIKAEIVPQGSTVNLFLRGGVDAVSAMSYNEYHMLLNTGLDPEDMTVFSYEDSGLNFPEDGIYCLKSTLDGRLDVCKKFVDASLKGWQYAFDHPGEALSIVMQHTAEAHTGTNYVHQRWMFEHMRDIMKPVHDGDPIGSLNRNDYWTAAYELMEQGLVKYAPSLEEFHAPCYR